MPDARSHFCAALCEIGRKCAFGRTHRSHVTLLHHVRRCVPRAAPNRRKSYTSHLIDLRSDTRIYVWASRVNSEKETFSVGQAEVEQFSGHLPHQARGKFALSSDPSFSRKPQRCQKRGFQNPILDYRVGFDVHARNIADAPPIVWFSAYTLRNAILHAIYDLALECCVSRDHYSDGLGEPARL